MTKKFMVELLHDEDGSGCSNLYVVVTAKNAFIAKKIVARMYEDDDHHYVSTAWEYKG